MSDTRFENNFTRELAFALPAAQGEALTFVAPLIPEPDPDNPQVSALRPLVLTIGTDNPEIVVTNGRMFRAQIGNSPDESYCYPVTRAAQGTALQAWPAGTKVSIRFTAGSARQSQHAFDARLILTQAGEILVGHRGDVLTFHDPVAELVAALHPSQTPDN